MSCRICGHEYGRCDVSAHKARILKDTGGLYALDERETVKTRWYEEGVSPTVKVIDDGVFAEVMCVRYVGEKPKG